MVQEPLDDDDSTSSSSDGENDDPGGYESRVVASVESDTVLRVYEAFSERVRSWDWIKAWGHQRTSIVLRTLEAEVVDVSYNEEEIDGAIPIERIHVLPSKEELEAKYLGKHVRLDGERGKIVAVYDDDTADVEYADEEMQNDYGVSIDELEFCGPPGETPRERKGSSAGKDGSDAEDGNEGTRPSTAAPAVGALDRDVPIVAGSSEEGRPKTTPSADPLRPLTFGGWMMITDTNSTGLPYYHRAETNETVWEKPDEYAKATLAGWERFFDAATSCAYWSNALTGEVRWTEPERYANYDGNSSSEDDDSSDDSSDDDDDAAT